MSKNLNFIDPEAFTKSLDAHLDGYRDSASLDAIKQVLSHGPLTGDPIAFAKAAKGVKPSRVRDPNADDAVSKDEDEDADDMDEDEDQDECASATERADLQTRAKLRAKAARKKAARAASNKDAAKRAIKSIHALAPRPEDPDALLKAAQTPVRYVDDRDSVQEIKAAHSRPMSLQKLFSQGVGNHPINTRDVERIVERGRRELRKTAGLSGSDWNRMSWPQRLAAMGKADTNIRFSSSPDFPPNSANAQWGGRIASTGAVNDFRDEGTQSPAVGHAGGFSDSAISPDDSRIRAAVASVNGGDKDTQVAAIKRDLWPQKKRDLAANFAARPAARVNDDIR